MNVIRAFFAGIVAILVVVLGLVVMGTMLVVSTLLKFLVFIGALLAAVALSIVAVFQAIANAISGRQ